MGVISSLSISAQNKDFDFVRRVFEDVVKCREQVVVSLFILIGIKEGMHCSPHPLLAER